MGLIGKRNLQKYAKSSYIPVLQQLHTVSPHWASTNLLTLLAEFFCLCPPAPALGKQVLKSCLSLLIPFLHGSRKLPCDLCSLTDIRNVMSFPFVQILVVRRGMRLFLALYILEWELEVLLGFENAPPSCGTLSYVPTLYPSINHFMDFPSYTHCLMYTFLQKAISHSKRRSESLLHDSLCTSLINTLI